MISFKTKDNKTTPAQSTGAIKYTDNISAEGYKSLLKTSVTLLSCERSLKYADCIPYRGVRANA